MKLKTLVVEPRSGYYMITSEWSYNRGVIVWSLERKTCELLDPETAVEPADGQMLLALEREEEREVWDLGAGDLFMHNDLPYINTVYDRLCVKVGRNGEFAYMTLRPETVVIPLIDEWDHRTHGQQVASLYSENGHRIITPGMSDFDGDVVTEYKGILDIKPEHTLWNA